jgi:uncharacterized protein (UPF0332 family)
MLGVGLDEAAGRNAYLTGFHAAQAFLFEKLGRAPKTHSGVQTRFAKLAQSETKFDLEMRTFLGRTYNLKAIADYETGPGAKVTPAKAAAAVTSAKFCDGDHRLDSHERTLVHGLIPIAAGNPSMLDRLG